MQTFFLRNRSFKIHRHHLSDGKYPEGATKDDEEPRGASEIEFKATDRQSNFTSCKSIPHSQTINGSSHMDVQLNASNKDRQGQLDEDIIKVAYRYRVAHPERERERDQRSSRNRLAFNGLSNS